MTPNRCCSVLSVAEDVGFLISDGALEKAEDEREDEADDVA